MEAGTPQIYKQRESLTPQKKKNLEMGLGALGTYSVQACTLYRGARRMGRTRGQCTRMGETKSKTGKETESEITLHLIGDRILEPSSEPGNRFVGGVELFCL